MRHYTVTENDNARRLDHYLAQEKPDFTRSFIQKMIKGGSVFVNDKKWTHPGHRLSTGDEVVVIVPSIIEVGIKAEKIPLDVVFEDKDLLVINKPAGMVAHPTDHGAHVSGTVVNAALYHCKDLSGIGGEKRPGIVHRIDKFTSGLLVVAKNDQTHVHVSNQIINRTITKRYLTLLKGHLTPNEGSIEAPLLKRDHEKDVVVSNRPDAKYALTHYKVMEYIGDFSLAEVQIVTGRTHQIRVHFASIGHPVAGDEMYGDKATNEKLKAETGLNRQFLHAAYLKFRHPKTEKEMELSSPLPKDLKAVIKKLSEL